MQPLNQNDPAPSRIAYRMQRLWLTPFFRFFARKVVPAFTALALILLVFTNETVVKTAQDSYASLRDMIESRPEFAVKETRVSGASDDTQDAVIKAMALTLPQSSFDLDFAALTASIKALDAVEEATLAIKERGVIDVDVVERQAAVIWRGPDGMMLLDATGQKVADIALRDARADLPLIAGRSVPKVTPEALQLLDIASDLSPRIRGLVRKGERRWDLVLDRNQRILLPEDNAAGALAHALTLHRTNDVLNRDIAILDMRNPARVTVRLSKGAVQEFRAPLLASQEQEL